MRRLLLCIPGILTDMNDAAAWFRVFAARFDSMEGCSGLPYAYSAGVAGAPVSLDPMAAEVGALLGRAQGHYEAIDVAVHSHGAAIILRALVLDAQIKVRNVILIAGAAPEDCIASGLNLVCGRDQIEQATVCYSPNDTVLMGPGTFPGYGQLGLKGPTHMSAATAARMRLELFDCNHGGYFDADHVERTWAIVSAAVPPAADPARQED